MLRKSRAQGKELQLVINSCILASLLGDEVCIYHTGREEHLRQLIERAGVEYVLGEDGAYVFSGGGRVILYDASREGGMNLYLVTCIQQRTSFWTESFGAYVVAVDPGEASQLALDRIDGADYVKSVEFVAGADGRVPLILDPALKP